MHKSIEKLKYNRNQLTFIKKFHSATAEYTFFSSVHRTYTQINHILSRKTNFKRFKKIETIHSVLHNYNGIKLEINSRKIIGTSPNGWALNNVLLNIPWVKEEILRKPNSILKWIKWKCIISKFVGYIKRIAKRELYNTKCIHYKIVLKQSAKLQSQEARFFKWNKPKSSKRGQIIKVKAEIKEIENKRKEKKLKTKENKNQGESMKERTGYLKRSIQLTNI